MCRSNQVLVWSDTSRYLEHQIVAGILRSGDRIQGTRVVDQLAVSRGSVRESFRVLERRRLIDVIPGQARIVTSLSPSRVQDLTSALSVILTPVVSDLVPHWSPRHAESIDEAGRASGVNLVVSIRCAFWGRCVDYIQTRCIAN